MKKLLFLSLLLLSTVGIFAQHEVGTLSIQPKVGLNIADFRHAGRCEMRLGLAAGAEVEYQLAKRFSMSAGVLYSQQGTKRTKKYILMMDAKENIKVDYINIPVMANVYVAEGLSLKLGVQPAFNVRAKSKSSLEPLGIYSLSSLSDIGDDVKKFDFSIPIGISYEFKYIVVDARYNYGVTALTKGSEPRNSVFQFTAGYKFCL